jgi:uncharacterized membrane protein
MKPFSKNDCWRTLVIFFLINVFLVISLSFYYPLITSILIVLAGFGWAFLPGFFLTILLFPYKKNLFDPFHERDKSLDILERLLLSVLLSIVFSLLVFMLLQNAKIVINSTIFALATFSVNLLLGITAMIILIYRKASFVNRD